MDVTIRCASPRDAEILGRFGAGLMQTHFAFDPQRFLEPAAGVEHGYASFLTSLVDDEDACVLVAEAGDRVVGYVYAALEPLSWKELRGPAGFIHDLYVDEEHRSGAIGSKLMDAALDWLRAQGAPRVVLWTAAPNERARAMFRRRGFRDTMVELTMEL